MSAGRPRLLRAIDALLVLQLATIAYRVVAGPIELELLGLELSFERYRNPLFLLAWLAAARAVLSWALASGLRHPVRAALLAGGAAASTVSAAHASLASPAIAHFWTRPLTFATQSERELLAETIGPLRELLDEAERRIPPDAAVLLETTERPYFLAYYLHPRKVYLHPEAAAQLDRANTYDRELEVRLHPHPPDAPCPLIESRNIGWRIHLNARDELEYRVERLDRARVAAEEDVP